jgi:hypothetical protein
MLYFTELAQVAMILICNQEMLGSKLSQDDAYPDLNK